MDIAALQRKMRDVFCVEATDLLLELDSSMLELESRPQDADLLNRVFRAIHTIKGSGATAGFNEMAAFTHHVEELFDEARMGRLTITPEMIDLALQAKDLIGQLLESDSPVTLEPACAQVVEALAKFLPHKANVNGNGHAKPANGPAQRQRHKIFFKPHAQIFFSGTDPVNLVDELCTLGGATVTARIEGFPSLESLNPEQCYLAWEVELLSEQPTAKIKEVFVFVEDESELRIESRPEPASVEPEDAGPLAAFLNIAGQSVAALGGFLSHLREVTEPDLACCKNYLRVLKTLKTAAGHQELEKPAILLEEQIHFIEEARETSPKDTKSWRLFFSPCASTTTAGTRWKRCRHHHQPVPPRSPRTRRQTDQRPKRLARLPRSALIRRSWIGSCGPPENCWWLGTPFPSWPSASRWSTALALWLKKSRMPATISRTSPKICRRRSCPFE
jgi:chemotaxis protein histidine kinase CheA